MHVAMIRVQTTVHHAEWVGEACWISASSTICVCATAAGKTGINVFVDKKAI
jgi:hypothetical protein